ncbi:MAG: sigma-54 dependent transcriptional regulator [uncultured Solirubrobacteraceae bacterium]|uniref:Sigma-54 dependent transcriptional regulator n=1 Tax=uncultured Solirubrobacteraceae bacterium TaxID=1162706 RepID=A0A6J4S553_9ACTN|nr:MAG: sigma-54 dependent transcriptional regulator [uncultured Solirubrobacteraceae bacterium]
MVVAYLGQHAEPDSEIADLYGLKAAVGGDFYVVSADAGRIVLGNRRCPFGTAVRHEPALCRMTSSVFGGIAARNTERSAVALEQRIALGDPECRVVVWRPSWGTSSAAASRRPVSPRIPSRAARARSSS